MLVALKRAGCGLALVALKKNRLWCVATGISGKQRHSKCSKSPPYTQIHASSLFVTDQSHCHIVHHTLLKFSPCPSKPLPQLVRIPVLDTPAPLVACPRRSNNDMQTIHTHTHTRLTALCPGLTEWAGTRKVKPIWILLNQETVSGSGISWVICKSAPRSRQITTLVPHHAVFYRPDALPVAQPTASKYWRQISYADNRKH